MRRFAMSAAMLLLAGSAHAQVFQSPEEPYWTPDAATIAKLEAQLKIESWPDQNQAGYPLTQYDRYYAGVTVRGRRMVRGKLIVPPNREDHPKTGIHITAVKYLPQLHGGGCANVSVVYSLDSN